MQILAQSVFTGIWRSFKIFKHSGGIRLNTDKHFKEFTFDAHGILTVKIHEGDLIEKVVETDQWSVAFENKKHFLHISVPKLVYEVITVNHTVMVLADNAYNEKTFFARENLWRDFLTTNRAVLM